MNFEMMEIKIYEEYKGKVETGRYNGRVVLDELKKGDYLIDMDCKNIDMDLFKQVAQKIKNEMEQGFYKEISKAPFFVRGALGEAKYGERLFGVSINNNVIKSVSGRIEELKRTLVNYQNRDSNRLYDFSMSSNRNPRDIMYNNRHNRGYDSKDRNGYIKHFEMSR